MFLRSIRSSIAAFTSISIILACAAVLTVALSVHEELYVDSVKKDLDGLSSNLASDLLPLMSETELDSFAITTALLRLDRYENVKFSIILDSNFEQVEIYGGKALESIQEVDIEKLTKNIGSYTLGVEVVKGELIAFKKIGEPTIPQGYLLVINDIIKPLSQSKRSLLYQVLPLSLVVIGLGIFVSLWQNYRLLMPLKTLTELARKIKRTNDYSIDLNIDGKREVKDLSDEMNSMMHTIDYESTMNKEYTEQLKTQQHALEFMANFDSLTSLPNRHRFMAIAETTLKRTDDNSVLIYCDLDGFKTVNDLHGHEIGDKLLIAVSQRLQHFVREGDVISRIGGDEFLILLSQNPSKEQIRHIAQSIVLGLSEPFSLDSWEVNVSASLGLCRAQQANGDVSKLIANADIAMYQAKLAGKNTFSIFEEEMMQANIRRLDIANAIPHAIKTNEFQLFYQAKVNRDEEIIGFEALIRWFSNELGFVSPVELISIAEQSAKIGLITEWVIEQVCKDVGILKKNYGDDLVVSLNLSANDLKDEDLIKKIRSSFSKYNVTPKSIEFEVTESAFLDNFEGANEFFDTVAQMGCSIALDDFGTGYSSLSYLTKINLNTLKIDKQFIDGIGVSKRTTLVTKTIVKMARNLNLKVCAEGVELPEQKAFLDELDCEQLQGYLFAKPQPLGQLLEAKCKTQKSA